MYLHVGFQLLPKYGDVVVAEHCSIKRIPPIPRTGRGVGRFPLVAYGHPHDGQHDGVRNIGREGYECRCQVHSLEEAIVDGLNLFSIPFRVWSSKNCYLEYDSKKAEDIFKPY